MRPKLYADFNNQDAKRRVRLVFFHHTKELETLKLELRPGLEVLLDDENGLQNIGIIEYSDEEKIWVAQIDWDRFIRYGHEL